MWIKRIFNFHPRIIQGWQTPLCTVPAKGLLTLQFVGGWSFKLEFVPYLSKVVLKFLPRFWPFWPLRCLFAKKFSNINRYANLENRTLRPNLNNYEVPDDFVYRLGSVKIWNSLSSWVFLGPLLAFALEARAFPTPIIAGVSIFWYRYYRFQVLIPSIWGRKFDQGSWEYTPIWATEKFVNTSFFPVKLTVLRVFWEIFIQNFKKILIKFQKNCWLSLKLKHRWYWFLEASVVLILKSIGGTDSWKHRWYWF